MRDNNALKYIFSEQEIKKATQKMAFLRKPKFTLMEFLNTRLLIVLISFTVVLINDKSGYIGAPLVAIMVYYLYTYIVLDKPIKERAERLDNDALMFFEVFTLALESGKNLENSLETSVMNVDNEVSKEFAKVLMEVKFGKSLEEALDDMRKRIPSETVNNIILNMTQTSIFGSRIIDTMNNQVNFLREKKLLSAKGKINKLPNQISIISVLFIVPLILLLVLGPFLINLLTS